MKINSVLSNDYDRKGKHYYAYKTPWQDYAVEITCNVDGNPMFTGVICDGFESMKQALIYARDKRRESKILLSTIGIEANP